jgi:hypothetical protein
MSCKAATLPITNNAYHGVVQLDPVDPVDNNLFKGAFAQSRLQAES